jgi:hypothetical protein
MSAALQSLQDQYILLTNNLPRLLAACHGDTKEEDAINTQYATADGNYHDCVNKIFHDNDANVQTVVAQMKEEQTALKAALKDLSAMAAVITVITTAVQVGKGLASLAA